MSVLVEAEGGPLAVCIAGANLIDRSLLEALLDNIILDRPQPSEEHPQHLCLDKAYDRPEVEQALVARNYTPHIRRIGEEKWDADHQRTQPARRWVVERTFAWLRRCRAIMIRYDKKAQNYIALIALACTLLWYRRAHRLAI
jgi:putative transposase